MMARPTLIASRTASPMNFLDRLFHRARPKHLVNATPNQEFKRLVGNREIEIRARGTGRALRLMASQAISR